MDAVVVNQQDAVDRKNGTVVGLQAEFVVRRGRREEIEDVARGEAVAARHRDAGPRRGVRMVQRGFDLLEVGHEIREVRNGDEPRRELVVGSEETGRISGIRRARPVGLATSRTCLIGPGGIVILFR